MKIKCEYCGELIDEEVKFCTNCGAQNVRLKESSQEGTQKHSSFNGKPRTIEELKQWYIDRNLPDENITRFFIGKDYKQPKAFGIYEDTNTGRFVVYKNKADGSRAVRYEGTDEEFAVNEMYMKLKEEILNQKENNSGNKKKGIDPVLVKVIIVALFLMIPILFDVFSPNRGYYKYNNNYYYYQSGSWYGYNRYGGWDYVDAPTELRKNYSDYYTSNSYNSYYNIDSFEDSSYYVEPSSSDSDSDWSSSDSWDSSSTDWDSDW